jgi:hypothetical protein
MYAFRGLNKVDVNDERSEVACLRASLSVQDFDRVGRASGREGLRRRRPRWEKLLRPRRADTAFSIDDESELEVALRSCEVADMVGGALVHGVASS